MLEYLTDLTPEQVQRYWSHVDKSGGADACWIWNGAKAGGAYGYYGVRLNRFQTVSRLAHRWAWIITYGNITDGLRVCHRCDTPPCCNPAHLFLGTDADNTQDKLAKGRQHSKLTWEHVRDIRQLGEEGFLLKDIAPRYGIAASQISLILQGKRWRNDPLEGIAESIPVNTHSYTSENTGGENNSSAKLTWEQVREIRRLGNDGHTQRELAKIYNVSQPHIGCILRNERWNNDPLAEALEELK